MKKYKIISSFGLGALATTAISAAAIVSRPASADSPTRATASTASVTVSATCSMTSTVTEAHTAEVPNGTYQNDIGSTTLKAFCNDANGFAIYAVGYTNDTRGNTALVSSTLGSNYNIPTGITIDGSTSNWAMKVNSVSGTYTPSIQNGFDSYSTIPTQYTKVAKYNNTTDQPATTGVGSSVTTTYAASISPTQPAGTYTGQVKYVLVHPSTAAAPDAYSMQDVQDWKGEVLVNEEVQVYDERDNKTYTVARLCMERDSSNNCTDSELWMTQNLDFVPDTTRTYTHADTDLGYTTNDTTATWTPNSETLATPATISAFNSGTTDNVVTGWTNSDTRPYIAEGGDTYVYNGTIYTSLSACEAAHTEADCLHYHVGNYYNWTAAIASNNSTGTYTDPTVAPDSICPAGWRLPEGLTDDNGTIVQSEFNQMLLANDIAAGSDTTPGPYDSATISQHNVGYTSGGFNKMINKPYFFARSGRVSSSTLYSFSTNGYYWSSSAQSSSQAYLLGFASGVLYAANRNYRYNGWSVRCVAR